MVKHKVASYISSALSLITGGGYLNKGLSIISVFQGKSILGSCISQGVSLEFLLVNKMTSKFWEKVSAFQLLNNTNYFSRDSIYVLFTLADLSTFKNLSFSSPSFS